MYLVALTRLGRPFDDTVRAIGQQLLESDPEIRARLRGQPPWLVLCTESRDDALASLAALREAGHAAVAFDSAAVRSSVEMVSMRTFQLRMDGVVGHSPTGDPLLLPFEDVQALVRAVIGDHVLYVFRNSGEMPWMLRERGTTFTGLGERRHAEPRRNFVETVVVLQTRAPQAVYDERLLQADLEGTQNLLQHGRARHQPTQAPPHGSTHPPAHSSTHPPARGSTHPPAPGSVFPPRGPAHQSSSGMAAVNDLGHGFGSLTARPPPIGAEHRRRTGPGGNVWDEDATVRTVESLSALLIAPTDPPHVALRITTDAMAHALALAHARQFL